MKDGRLPPRLLGGVTYELTEKLSDAGSTGLEGRQEVEENSGLEITGRGMADGDVGGLMEAEGGSDGGVIITGKASAGAHG
jgi:hypothetical protein